MRLDLGECVLARPVLCDSVWSLRTSIHKYLPVQNSLWHQLDEQLDEPLWDSLTNALNALQESLYATR